MGYATVVVWEIAIDRLRTADRLVTRESIQESLEALRGIQTGGLLPPISYSSSDHRPTMSVDIYRVDGDGALAYENTTVLERKPDGLGY
jgi:branched-chain amino acid transport system substrate-binding protein